MSIPLPTSGIYVSSAKLKDNSLAPPSSPPITRRPRLFAVYTCRRFHALAAHSRISSTTEGTVTSPTSWILVEALTQLILDSQPVLPARAKITEPLTSTPRNFADFGVAHKVHLQCGRLEATGLVLQKWNTRPIATQRNPNPRKFPYAFADRTGSTVTHIAQSAKSLWFSHRVRAPSLPPSVSL
jgi:hypothetical protein